jgi:predicted transposase YbfD/YdcC
LLKPSAIIPPSDPDRIDNGPPPDLRHAQTIGKAHGRLETRRIATSSEAVVHLDWPGLAQIARLERTREIKGKVTTETVYLITSLPAADAPPERLLALNRAHWGIENKLHYVRDVSMDEDRCRVRAGARALSGVRNGALEIIRRSGQAIRQARENFREDRAEAIKAVTGRIL